MPYRAERSSKCPASKPWAAVKTTTGEVMGCHMTQADALAQCAALYANEKPKTYGDYRMRGASGSTDWPLAEQSRTYDENAAEARIQKWASSDGSGDKQKISQAKYASVHFWRSAGNDPDGDGYPDNLGDYKLKFCDVVDGKVVAVWHAITAAAAVMQGARGGVDIPEGDRAGVKAKIAAYYAKASKTFGGDFVPPWEASSGPKSGDALVRSIHGIEIRGLVAGKHRGLEGHFFSGTATTPRLDRIGDIVRPQGARFSKSAMPRLMLYHNSTKPVGEIVEASPTDKGLPFRAFIPKVAEPGTVRDRTEEALHSIKYRLLPAVSIGFNPDPKGVERIDTGYEFKVWDWLELSLVTVPANPDAMVQMTGVKSIDDRLRAALGESRRDGRRIFLPGASGNNRDIPLEKGRKMFDIKQTLQDLRDKREAAVHRRDELAEKAKEAGSFSALSRDELAEHDQVALKDLPELDAEIARWSAHDAGAAAAMRLEPAAGYSREDGSAARGGKTKETPKTEPGVALAQYVKMMYRAKGIPMQALAFAERLRGLDPRVITVLKAAVNAGTTSGTATAGDWGMELVGHESNIFADFIEFLRPQTILGKFGANGIPALKRVPFRVPLIGMIAGGEGYWTGEGKPKGLTSFEFSRTHLEPFKLANICAVTKELLTDSSPAADPLIRDQLVAALRNRADIDFIDPNKSEVSGKSPASITNGVASIHSTGTGDAADVRADVKAAFTAFINANNAPTAGVWIMPETVALSLSMMMNALGQPEFPNVTMRGGSFLGLPVITSQNVATSAGGGSSGDIVVLVNATDVYFADDGGFVVDTSEHATLEMASTPDSSTGTLLNLWQENMVGFRAERRVDWARRRDSSVQVITGVNWGA